MRNKLATLYETESGGGSGETLFGEILGDIFAYGLDDAPSRIAREIGRGVGRAIYVIDAVDDIDEDKKAKRRNPIADAWSGLPTETAGAAVSDGIRLTLFSAGAAAELIEETDGAPESAAIVRNILFSGLPREADRVISKWKGEEEKTD